MTEDRIKKEAEKLGTWETESTVQLLIVYFIDQTGRCFSRRLG